MPWVVAGAAIGAIGAGVAAHEQSDAAKDANKAQQKNLAATQANEQPFIDAGNSALRSIMSGLGIGAGNTTGTGSLNKPFTPEMYEQSPEFQFLLNNGNSNILNNASAIGGIKSGNTLKALQSFGTGLANQDYQTVRQNYVDNQNQRFGQLDTIAGSGQNAVNNLGAFSANATNNIANNITGAGNASAAGTVGAANAATSGINNYLLYSILQNSQNGGGGYIPQEVAVTPDVYGNY